MSFLSPKWNFRIFEGRGSNLLAGIIQHPLALPIYPHLGRAIAVPIAGHHAGRNSIRRLHPRVRPTCRCCLHRGILRSASRRFPANRPPGVGPPPVRTRAPFPKARPPLPVSAAPRRHAPLPHRRRLIQHYTERLAKLGTKLRQALLVVVGSPDFWRAN